MSSQALASRPKRSAPRFDEALDIIRQAWTGERFSYTGKYYQVDDVQINVCARAENHIHCCGLQSSAILLLLLWDRKVFLL